jgi:murein DD-endopeptidase MepM/ murein hydrolase activator NlpD
MNGLEKRNGEDGYEERVAKLEARIAELKAKLAEEEEAEKNKRVPFKKISRRGFLRAAAVAAGATLLNTTPLDKSEIEYYGEPPLEPKIIRTPEEERGHQIKLCAEIIENRRYDEILGNPYLVSALYYTDNYINTIRLNGKATAQEIIANIYPLITREFREGYLASLQEKYKSRGGGNLFVNRRSSPLDSVHTGSDLLENHLYAIDLFMEEGSPVYSMSWGVVVLAEGGWKEDDNLSTSSMLGGNTVIIYNPHDEKFYRYAHLASPSVVAGEIVKHGEKIGTVGHTGINASRPGHGEHLHFEINRYNRQEGVMESENVFSIERALKTLQNADAGKRD